MSKNKTLIYNRRIIVLGLFKILSLFFVFERLFNLQIRQSDKYKKLAENNRISLSFILPQRGLIYDRYNQLLADNKEQYQLIFKFDKIENKALALKKVLSYIDLSEKKKQQLLNNIVNKKNPKQILLKSNLSWKEVAKISSNITELQGIYIEMILVRVYYSIASSHLLGFVGKPEKIKNPKLAKVEGTKVGKLGIELAFDKQLQGKFGIKKEEVNAFGRVVNEISRVNGVPGEDLNLSISKELQDFCFRSLNNKSGSIAVMNLTNGEILSLVSRPTFDSNDFVNELEQNKWEQIKSDVGKPLFHRSSMGTYPPGSIFKLIVVIAAFELQDFDPNKKFFCNGGYKFGNQVFHCWNEKGHGFINCEDAISMSCDCYFYDLSLKVGIDKISKVAKLFGLGKAYLDDIYASSPGLIPTKKWKKKKYNQAWTKSDTIVASIGQGFALATPLQLAVMIGRIAADGKEINPTILKSTNSTNNFSNFKQIVDYNRDAIDLIKKGMYKAVNDPNGTAYLSRIGSDKIMCGKTATSQVRRISMEEREEGIIKNEELPLEQRDHALFAGYYPYESPKYAFSIVVEHGGSGSKSAAPIAKAICKKLDEGFS